MRQFPKTESGAFIKEIAALLAYSYFICGFGGVAFVTWPLAETPFTTTFHIGFLFDRRKNANNPRHFESIFFFSKKLMRQSPKTKGEAFIKEIAALLVKDLFLI